MSNTHTSYIPVQDRDFFLLLRAGLWQKAEGQLSESPNWKYILRLACEQTVQGIVADGIALYKAYHPELQVDAQVYDEFLNQSAQIIRQNHTVNQVQAKVCKLLSESGITYFIVKGQEAAKNYHKPMLRCSGDIDIFVHPTNYGKSQDILERHSIKVEQENTQLVDTSYSFSTDISGENVEVELHATLHPNLGRQIDKVLDSLQADLFAGKENIQTFNAVYIFLHCLQHFHWSGLGIRQIIDWAMLLSKECSQINHKRVEADIKAMKIEKEYAVFCSFITQWLNVDPAMLGSYHDAGVAPHAAAADLWKECKASGNMGHSKPHEARIQNIFKRVLSGWKDNFKHYASTHDVSPRVSSILLGVKLRNYLDALAGKLKNVIMRPLRLEPVLFAVLCAVLCVACFSKIYCGATGLGTLVANIFFAYVATLIVSFLPKYLNTVVRWTLMIYSIAMAYLVFWGAIFIKTPSAMNNLMLILQTNTGEAKEFFEYYVHTKQVLMTLGITAACAIAAIIIYRIATGKSKITAICRGLITTGSLMTIPVLCTLPLNVLQTTPQLEICFTDLDLVFHHHDLREYAVLPDMKQISATHPANVVLIIGESHHRSHSSLYGYDKPTNPLLQQLADSLNLVAYDSVYAPAAYTGQSLRRMLSTYGQHMRPDEKGKQWWECQTIPTTFKAMGYETYWITNQKGGATRDAIADSYAQLCDHIIRTEGRNAYDEALLPIVAKVDQEATGSILVVIHLMGSHEAYNQRFPASFCHFHASDYPNLPENQRQTVADYDNSLLYNDYIVSEIFKLFDDHSTVAFYCPDHAVDLFMTDPTYAAHAKSDPQSQRVAMEIPMFVYMSDKYKEQNPDMFNRLNANKHKPYASENIIYLMTKLAGFEFLE